MSNMTVHPDRHTREQRAMKDTFAERLKRCREQRGLSHEKLAEELGRKYSIHISGNALKNYEYRGEHTARRDAGFGMNILYLWTMAKYFNVSTNYLLGLHDEPSPNIDIQGIHALTGLSETAIARLRDCRNDLPHAYYTDIVSDFISNPAFRSLLEQIDTYIALYTLDDDVFRKLSREFTTGLAETLRGGAQAETGGKYREVSLECAAMKRCLLWQTEQLFTSMVEQIAGARYEKAAAAPLHTSAPGGSS